MNVWASFLCLWVEKPVPYKLKSARLYLSLQHGTFWNPQRKHITKLARRCIMKLGRGQLHPKLQLWPSSPALAASASLADACLAAARPPLRSCTTYGELRKCLRSFTCM